MGGSSNSPTVEQTSTVKLGPEQKRIADLAFPMAEQYASTPLQQFQGTGIAPITPLQQQAQQQYVTQAAPVAGQLANQSAQAQGMTLDPNFMLDVANNPYLQAAMSSMTGQVTDNLNENILPGLRSGATQAGGMYSGPSSRSGVAEGLAVGKTSGAISDTIAKTMFDAYNRGLTGMEGAIGRTGQVQGQQLTEGDILGAVGSQQQDLQQRQLDEQIKKYYTDQALPLMQAQDLMALISGMPGGTAVGTATGAVPKVNPAMGALGGAASGAALGSAVMPGVGTAVGGTLGALLGLTGSR